MSSIPIYRLLYNGKSSCSLELYTNIGGKLKDGTWLGTTKLVALSVA